MVGWVEVIFRSIVAVFLMWAISKLFVRKSFSQLTLFEAMSTVAIAVIAAISSVQLSIPFVFPVISLLTWGFIIFAGGSLAIKSKRFRNLYYGKGIPLIRNGKVLEEAMKKQRYSTDELLSQLRKKDVFQAADVEFAILEPAGEISVLLKKQHQPLVAKDFGFNEAKIKEPQAVIMDGKVLDESLAVIGLNRGWLEVELDKIGVAIENVFLGQVDQHGQLHVDLFDDQIQVPDPMETQLVITTMKKVQADLETFALDTDNKEAKKMYAIQAENLQQLINKLEPHLQS
ncbi:MAG TPA: DUF421 domain-containing protein [Bacilli bacterium]|nr:DUF421 domain-containing protein [Bacilli bacterium]